ncbi:carbohydrate ABC transporter permease [Modestobacter roseus]|uniref:Multiple sugar transport system permease protein n=1 Tax=Modestobacter roseus TaxID=1181884 RepID=A0A562IMI9_9ACTN|nr:sugar ABC transporter permease [Modestobacter roseus]MQA34128.1 ABC transporter permease subunit [Modestobacter roseus]TWH72128.1 multiple sugar transport system permease protein [Modestobacter roseus]
MATLDTAPRPQAPAAHPAPARSRRRRRGRTQGLIGWAFLAPFAVVFLVFLVAPLLYAFYLSLFSKGLATGERFAGLDNYTRAFTDPAFLNGVWFVVRFSLVVIPVQILVALAAALVLDSVTSRFARFSRLMIFVPYAIPAVIGAVIWGFLYSPNFGPLEQLFGDGAPFLLSPDNLFYGFTNVVTWQWAGYYMIIIYAALQGIDPAVYEAARIDGAGSWQIATRIKIPMISSALILILVFSLIGTLQFFTEPQVLTPISNGAISTDITPNVYAFNLAFRFAQFNYASAISFALGFVVFIGVYVFLFLTRKRGGFLK